MFAPYIMWGKEDFLIRDVDVDFLGEVVVFAVHL